MGRPEVSAKMVSAFMCANIFIQAWCMGMYVLIEPGFGIALLLAALFSALAIGQANHMLVALAGDER